MPQDFLRDAGIVLLAVAGLVLADFWTYGRPTQTIDVSGIPRLYTLYHAGPARPPGPVASCRPALAWCRGRTKGAWPMTDQDGEPDPWVMQYEFTSKRLNRLASALGARSYLEIGVHTGGTFARVQVPERTAVDPAFPFPVSDHEDEVTIFAEMTSDEFFAGLPAEKAYDLIFIDGMHTFEQAYRDLCSSILHSHPGTPILMDDTVPSDVYSALRVPEQTFAFRAAAGQEGSVAWHGDTFKVVFAVHDFHLALDYRTIVGSGNPQTLMWRSNAGWRRPLLDSLERVSRMSYFDMVNNAHVLRECDEETALRECLTAVAPADLA